MCPHANTGHYNPNYSPLTGPPASHAKAVGRGGMASYGGSSSFPNQTFNKQLLGRRDVAGRTCGPRAAFDHNKFFAERGAEHAYYSRKWWSAPQLRFAGHCRPVWVT
jgi:hypothetical protein